MNWFRLFLSEVATEAGIAEGTQNPQGAFNDLIGMFDTFMLVMLLGFGAYGLYTVIRLRREMVLFPSKFLYPGNCDADSCLDPAEFILFILPRLTALSVSMLVFGVLFALNAYLFHFSHLAIDIIATLLPVGILVWYGINQRTAAKRFWGQ